MKVEFLNGESAFIDFDFLKKSYLDGRLKGSIIFARLFGLDNETPFKKEDFNKDFFVNYHITFKIWNHFIIFLKTGFIKNEYFLNDLMELSTKFSIKSIDDYYIQFYENNNKIKENLKNYNPQNPKEDIKQIYKWKICRDDNINKFQICHSEYSACQIFRLPVNTVTEYVYFRKLKD